MISENYTRVLETLVDHALVRFMLRKNSICRLKQALSSIVYLLDGGLKLLLGSWMQIQVCMQVTVLGLRSIYLILRCKCKPLRCTSNLLIGLCVLKRAILVVLVLTLLKLGDLVDHDVQGVGDLGIVFTAIITFLQEGSAQPPPSIHSILGSFRLGRRDDRLLPVLLIVHFLPRLVMLEGHPLFVELSFIGPIQALVHQRLLRLVRLAILLVSWRLGLNVLVELASVIVVLLGVAGIEVHPALGQSPAGGLVRSSPNLTTIGILVDAYSGIHITIYFVLVVVHFCLTEAFLLLRNKI